MESGRSSLSALSPGELAQLVLANTSDYAVVVSDLSGTIVDWNPSAEKVLGWTAAEAIGQPISIFFTPEDCAQDRPNVEMTEAAQCGCAKDERWHIKQDGTRFWASGEMSALRRDGVLMGYSKILRDRTPERLAAERLRLAQQVGEIGTFELHPAQGRITVSREMCQLWGLPEQESFQIEELIALIHPEDRARVITNSHEFLEGALDYVEYRIRRPDNGEERWMARRGEPILVNTREGMRYFGVCYDITDRKRAEQARLESDARLRNLTQEMQEGFFVAEPILDATGHMVDFRFIEVNPAFSQLTGLPPEQVQGRTLREALPHIDDTLIEGYARFIRHNDPVHFELQLQALEGRWFESWLRRLDPTRFVVLFLDVTARKQAEAALSESEARFKAITNSIDQMVWASRPDGHHYYFNERWYEFTGSVPEHTDGDKWIEIVHPDDREITWASWQQCLTSGEPYRTEFRLRHRSGQYRWVLGRAQPVRNERGAVEGWFGTSTDIQDIIDAREVLSRSREELEKQIELRTRERDRIWRLSNDLMKVCQLDGRLISVNEAWYETLGWSENDLLGRNYLEFIHPDDVDRVTHGLSIIDQERRARSYEVRLLHQNGNYRLTSWTAVPEEGLIYSVGRDITEQRQLEDQLRQSQKMEAVGQLTGGIAHDFNNLLTGIIGSLDLMQRRYESGRAQDLERYMSAAVTSAQRAAALTQRLLAFSRRQALDLKPVNLNTLVASMEELLRRTIGEKIVLDTTLAAGLWPALTDTNQLESALLNLVINARDAMPEGGTITIATSSAHFDEHTDDPHLTLAPGDYVVLCVNDTGTGMSPEVIERAFDPFFTTKPIGQGTGLGLSMIYGYAKQSKGQVRIFSTQGKGTSVRLYLPRYRGALDEHAINTERQLLKGSGETVLVVEDETIVRSLIVEVLDELGYSSLEAVDAQQAIPLLQNGQQIDLMISDVGLPGMNGRQLADVARTLRPELKILFATGYAEGAQVEGYLGENMEIITKPFNVDALASKIQEMIKAQD